MIHSLEDKVPVRFLCRYFSVSTSSYYYWRSGHNNPRLQTKAKIKSQIQKFFALSKGTYGSPRIYQELNTQGITVSENTVAKYMNELGLDARLKKKYRVMTTNSNHKDPIAPRLFKTECEHTLPTKPHQVLAGDITYLKLGTKFIYLAVVLDLYSREVMGWSMGSTLETSLVLKALDAAMRVVGPSAEVIFHSDRGSQYASEAYRRMLKNKDIKPSMSRRGNCYDNAYVESWFASLKKEWIYRSSYRTEDELRALVFEFIEIWYNKKRTHSSLGYLSPVEYRVTTTSA